MFHKTLSELSALLHRREISSVELTRIFIERAERFNPYLNAFITLCVEQALETARTSDRRLASGQAGALTGIPIAHKDIFLTRGIKTSCASRMLDSFIAPYDATVVKRLASAGMVLLGKTNMDEFAMGSSSESSYYGPVKNPWDMQRVPGGSSGGSATAVAARLAPAATGTDTGGSIRQPAALCGITGLKPTYGRVSRWGMIAFASSLDQGGPMTQCAQDAAMLLGAMAGFDPRDATSVERPVDDYSAQLEQDLHGLRIGLPKEYFSDGLDQQVAVLIDGSVTELKRLGVIFREITLPHTELSIPAYYVIAPAECSSNLARYDGVRFGYRCKDPRDLQDLYCRSRAEGFGAEVKRRILIGTYALSAGYYDAYYVKAQRVRRLIRDDFQRALQQVDVIAGPTAPGVAFRLAEKTSDPLAMYLSDVYTIPANLAGLPAMSIPVGRVGALPVGMQLIADYFQEGRLLNLAHRYQQVTEWHRQIPAEFAS
ncbi:MAG: Asp-tRNA(Asn)/Glu-tRNA(Gln) amidotransferase subunit GatA [Gammaproteobacteria bacterium]